MEALSYMRCYTKTDMNITPHKSYTGQLIRPFAGYESFTKPPSPYLSRSLCNTLSHSSITRAAAVDGKMVAAEVLRQSARPKGSERASACRQREPTCLHLGVPADAFAEFIDSGRVSQAVNDKHFCCRISFRCVCGSTAVQALPPWQDLYVHLRAFTFGFVFFS